MPAFLTLKTAPSTRLPGSLSPARSDTDDDLPALDRLGTVISLRRNGTLFVEGDAARYCFKVLTGAARSCRLFPDGRRHIGDFFLPGDFIGFDAQEQYRFSAEAVTDTTLLRYDRHNVERMLLLRSGLGRRLLDRVYHRLSVAQEQMLLLGRKSASERVASFLLVLSERNGKADRISLPMSRGDIADYLGLTVETVSRVFTHFKTQGTIQLESAAEVIIKDGHALENMAEGV